MVSGETDVTENYTLGTQTAGRLTIGTSEVTVTVGDKTATYDGTEQSGNTNYTFGNVADGQTATITYTPARGTAADVYDNGSYDAATFRVVSGGTDVTENYTLGTQTTGRLTIGKAPLTITAKDQNMYVGDNVPAWTADSYTVTGLLGTDTLDTEPAVEYRQGGTVVAVDVTKPGEYEIWPANAAAGSYGISYASGRLELTYAPDDPDPDPAPAATAVINQEHGSVSIRPAAPKPGETVVVTLIPDEGYAADWVTVTDSKGESVKVTKNEDGTFSYTEPESGAEVRGEFLKEMKNPFEDVHEGDYFYDPVIWAVEKGITEGTDETHFSPEDPCTRGQVLTFLWRAAGCPEPTITECPFEDVSEDAYYYKAVLWAYENGITLGVDDDHFAPDETITRGESLTFLYRAKGIKTKGENPFKDVKTNDYYYDAIIWGYAGGVTVGADKDSFSPGGDCRREHIITFLYRAYHM